MIDTSATGLRAGLLFGLASVCNAVGIAYWLSSFVTESSSSESDRKGFFFIASLASAIASFNAVISSSAAFTSFLASVMASFSAVISSLPPSLFLDSSSSLSSCSTDWMEGKSTFDCCSSTLSSSSGSSTDSMEKPPNDELALLLAPGVVGDMTRCGSCDTASRGLGGSTAIRLLSFLDILLFTRSNSAFINSIFIVSIVFIISQSCVSRDDSAWVCSPGVAGEEAGGTLLLWCDFDDNTL